MIIDKDKLIKISSLLADNDKLKRMEISCVSCSDHRLFSDKSSFEIHHRKDHEKQELLYGCAACDYNSKKFVLLKNHYKRHVVSKNLHCNECPEVFAQKNELNHHKTTIHNIKICRKCNMEFHNFENYMQHKNNNHDDLQAKASRATTPLECPDCGKILMTQGGLQTHRKMHSEAPKYKCEACQKKFFQKVNLVNHTKTHNIQNRSYSCTKCDKKFFEKAHLQRHQNFHQISRDYQCSECHKFYKTERCLKVHKQVHNPVHMRPFRCQEAGCNKSFLSSSKLKQHGNIHNGTRPFLCKHCPRDFTNYPNLLKHTIRRHKVDHRTGLPLAKIPDYVTNKKKKKTDNSTAFPKSQDKSLVDDILKHEQDELNNFNVIHIPDDDDLLPRGFQLNVGEQTYDSMSILMDIDQEFSDFQLLSPSNDCNDQQEENDIEQFSIIDTTGKIIFFNIFEKFRFINFLWHL